MKIGILTYHRSHNYGALLQAIALRHQLAEYGHDVYFVDYWPDYHRRMYLPFNSKNLFKGTLRSRAGYLVRTLKNLKGSKQRINLFNRFIEKHVVPYCRPVDEGYDLIVCGSDQIWRKQHSHDGKYNVTYFGGGDLSTKRYASYAASMGEIEANEEDIHQIGSLLKKFSHIAVREKDLQELVKKAGIADVELVSDPTLLLNQSDWREIFNIPESTEDYVLFYDLMSDSFNVDNIREFAKNRGMSLKVLKGRIEPPVAGAENLYLEDPEGMMKLIANAKYVFTSSYHGLVFSIIFHRDFCTAFNTNKGRAESLLHNLGLSERLLSSPDAKIPQESIDYSIVEKNLNSLRQKSLLYIEKMLNP